MTRLRQLGITGAFISVTTLFFAWGFITSNNDPLIVALRAVFQLNYTEALLTQFVFFLAYGMFSLPAASLGQRLGTVGAIVMSLCTMIAGCLLVRSSVHFNDYVLILASLFVLAAGITALQVAANPLAAALGPAETSHFRLSFAQTFNSLGVVVGVQYGSRLMLGDAVLKAGGGKIHSAAQRTEALSAVSHAFTIMAMLLGLLALFVLSQRKRITVAANQSPPAQQASALAALRSRWAVAGAAAIGLYVGAEVSIGSIMINFLHQRHIFDLPLESAGNYLATFYWGGALAGRIAGSFLLTRIAAPRLLGCCALIAIFLCLVVFGSSGTLAGSAALSIGLFNSIMFPTIFTITLERSGASQSSTSGLLCLAIVGGALLPLLVGAIADTLSLSVAFAVPAIAYGFIFLFALGAERKAPLSPAQGLTLA
ncbi:glucose/galactose MFS transporter [Novosphingobium naphthalenivorans]|uniref:glucose/galactose MFS transporter n=1 Tax=Novosphingobium naphthalenivorans TaxID=273168 RepID=UPI0008333267|nr:glucose/galactose MFS transporter [Novosphingobium naphthalenivorans]